MVGLVDDGHEDIGNTYYDEDDNYADDGCDDDDDDDDNHHFFYQIWLFAGVALVGVSTLPRQMSQLKQKNWSFISFSSNWENTNNEYILVSVVKNLEKNT